MSFNLQGFALIRNASGQYVQASQSAWLFLDPIGDQQTFTYSYVSSDSTEIVTDSFAAASVSDSVLGFGVDTLIAAPGVSIERWSWPSNPEYGFIDVLIVRQLAPLAGETSVDFLFLLSPIPIALAGATTTTEGTLAVLNSFISAPVYQGPFAPGNPILIVDIPDVSQNLNGTDSADVLTGNPGKDWISPGLGNDTIDGGLGGDAVFYEDLQFGVVANISDGARDSSPANSVTGGTQFTDTISNVGNFHLTQFDDTFYSNLPGGYVFLRAGNDAIQLDGVSRLIIPGSGNDTVTADPNNPSYLSYEADLSDAAGPQTSGIQVQFTDPSSGTVLNDGWGGVDTFTGVTTIDGSALDDVMMGSDSAQSLFGGAGDDILSGASGDDFLDGGDGNDTLDGGEGQDQLYGGDGNDTLNGDTGFDVISGGFGGDVITLQDGHTITDPGSDTYISTALAIITPGYSIWSGSRPQILFDSIYTTVAAQPAWSAQNNTIAYGEFGNYGSSIVVNTTEGYIDDGFGFRDSIEGAFDLHFVDHDNITVIGDEIDDVIFLGGGSVGARVADIDGRGGTDTVVLSSGFHNHSNLQEVTTVTQNDDGSITLDMSNVFRGVAEQSSITLRNIENIEIGRTGEIVAVSNAAQYFSNIAVDDVIIGTEGPDSLYGFNGDDTIQGLGGDDQLFGGDGNDTLDGGDGNDTLDGGVGNDTIVTGPGNSQVEGGPGDDVIDASALGGLNNAWVMPGSGSNTIIGSSTRWAQRPDGLDLSYQDVIGSGGLVFEVGANGSGTVMSNNTGVVADSFSFASRFRGTAENDTFFGSANPNWEGWEGQAGNDTINGGDGFDELLYHLDWQSGGNQGVTVDFVAGSATDAFGDTDTFTGIEAVRGTPFSDVLQGNEQIGRIRYRGLDGNDTVIGTSSYDVVDYSRDANYGGASGIVANLLDGSIQDGFGTIDNVSMVDEVRGTEQADIIDARGYANDVRIYGYGGDDQLYGGLGVDIINGGVGNDEIFGKDGNDILDGGVGNDSLFGGTGEDILVDGIGTDLIDGGLGIDTFSRDLSVDYSDKAFVPVIDLVAGRFYALTAPSDFDTLISIENVSVVGNFDYVIRGDAGDNVLLSDLGNDQLDGGSGSDTLDGGAGNDILTGGAGPDTFVFRGDFGNDIVTDFNASEDLLEFYTSDGAAIDASTFVESFDGSGNSVLTTGDGTSSVTLANSTSRPFTVEKSIVGDIITLEFVVNPAAAALDGVTSLGSFDVEIALDPLALDYVEGSFAAAPGFTGLPNELDSATGILGVGAFAFPEFTDFSQPLFSIDAVILDRAQPTSVDFSSVVIDGVSSVTAVELSDYTLRVELNNPVHGDLLIVGDAVEGVTLQVDPGSLSDPDGFGDFSYQWLADGVEIAGATGASHTLTQSEVGKVVSVRVTYIDQLGAAESVTSISTLPVLNVNDAPIGDVLITSNGTIVAPTDTVSEDQTLTADVSGIADEDGLGAFSYQWQRNGVDIADAIGSDYTLTQLDVAAAMSVVVSYVDGQGTPETVTSAQTGPVANVNDLPTGDVVITGTAAEDQTLTADAGSLADEDGLGTFSYQWQRDGVDISGASNSDYTLTQADVGAAMSVVVSYTDGQGTLETVNSAQTGPVANVNDAPTGGVSITGNVYVTGTVTADTSTLADEDGLGPLSYQWYADGMAVANATAASLTLTEAELGKTLTVEASYTDGFGTNELVTSAATAPVTPPVSAITTAVTHRFGQAMSDPEVSTTEIIGGNEVFVREVSSTDAGTVFELVAAPTANISTLDFEFTGNVDLINFQLGAALEGWTIQSNTAVANTVTVSGFGALNGSQDITAGVETVLATFETVASPDVVATGIFTNGVAQQDISLRDVPATSKLANVTVHEVANGADAFVFADMTVDLASENAVGSFDALQALRLAVGLTKSDGTAEWHDYFAADINKDGRVGSDDALNILKYAVGLTDGPAADWVFVDSTADYSGVTRQNSGYEEGVLLSDVVTDTTVDFTAILVGDVDGSYIV